MSILYNADLHTYTVVESGVVLPSITQIIDSTGFNAAMQDIPQHILRHAADRGSVVHLLCHAYDTKQEVDLSAVDPGLIEEAQPYLAAYIEWRIKTGWKLLEAENPRGSEDLGYGGTPDRIFEDHEGWRVIVEIKTSLKISATAHVQVAAQEMLLCEIDRSKRIVLQLTKEGTYKEHVSDDPGLDLRIWHNALENYQFMAAKKLLRRKSGGKP